MILILKKLKAAGVRMCVATGSPRPFARNGLERLGIRRINADCVTLDPSLLGPDFRREADNAILRKKGAVE